MSEHAAQHAQVNCHHCGQPATLVNGRTLYRGRRVDQAHEMFWRCQPCGAWARCEKGTHRPLSLVADSDLRTARWRASKAFAGLWRKPDGVMSHNEAVTWLMRTLDVHDARIEWFDRRRCQLTVDACIGYYLGSL